MKKYKIILCLVLSFVILTSNASILVKSKTTDKKIDEYKELLIENNSLDVNYIYNITRDLSNIIFTEYNEESGEIAKGRAYGTKGEQKAAEIIFKNMSNLGLYTYMERITNTEDYPKLIHEVEVNDYYCKINDEEIECYISPVWFETEENHNNLNYTYDYSDLKVIKPPISPFLYIQKEKLKGTLEPFLIIMKDMGFYTDYPICKLNCLDNFYFKYYVLSPYHSLSPVIYSEFIKKYHDYCKGIILYDYNEETYDMKIMKNKNELPFIFISGNNGKKILDNLEETRIDFKLDQTYNTSVVSNNVIGQINGTDPSKTVLVNCLYDSWWCQGTSDAAIGMGMVLGVAKYFKEHNIIPKYTVKFIAFAGEEHGFCAGSKHYASTHKDENILYVIDLNQIGFRQDDPILDLNIIFNKFSFYKDLWGIFKESDYANRVNSSNAVKPVITMYGGPTNCKFIAKQIDCKTVCFLKDGGWILHHRDGMNHTEGDVLKYFDYEDVDVTGELVLKVLKKLVCNET